MPSQLYNQLWSLDSGKMTPVIECTPNHDEFSDIALVFSEHISCARIAGFRHRSGGREGTEHILWFAASEKDHSIMLNIQC